MKKNLLYLLALSAMVAGGCSKSEVDEGTINSTNAITFETSADKLTKAPVLDESNVTNYKFGLYAYYTGQDTFSAYSLGEPNFMNDEDVEYTDGAWSYSPLKYWPNASKDKISFFGYLPKGTNVVGQTIVSGELPTISFTQEVTDPTKMTDLTAAQVLDQEKTTAAVNLPFKHILTRLNFAAKTDETLDAATTIKVTALRILGIDNCAGSTNSPIDNSGDNAASRFYSAANYQFTTDANVSGWDYTTPTQVAKPMGLAKIFNTSNEISSTEAQTPLFTTGEYLFLIPPHGKEGVKDDKDLRFQIEYTVTTEDAPMADIVTSKTAHFSMPNGSLVEGKAYNAIVTISLDAVKVTATPEGWDTEDDAYTVTAGEAQTADEIEAAITAAYSGTAAALTVTYKQNPADALDITIPEPASDDDLNIYLDLPYQTGAVNITTNDKYKGELTINAPNATVTVNGGTYINLTVWTASHTLIIAENATVDGLTINKGNVAGSGTLKGNVVRGTSNTDTTTNITMTGTTTDATPGTDVNINGLPSADGVYYSVDNEAWKILELSNNNFPVDGKSIKVITVGNAEYNMYTTGHNKAIAGNGFTEVDLSGVLNTNSDTDVYSSFFQYDNDIESIKLPNSNYITALGERAFVECTSLVSVVLPESLTTIGNKAFYNCKSLQEIVLPTNVTSIGSSSFHNCKELKTINLDNITSYGESAFIWCSNLNIEVNLNCDIPANLFHSCSSISKLTLGDNVTSIGDRAFYATKNLDQHLTIPATVTYIGTYAFNSSAITGVTITEGDNELTYGSGGKIFSYSNVSSFNFPKNVTKLALGMFSITKFTTLVIPSHIEINENSSYAFIGIQTLKELKVEEGDADLDFPYIYFDNLKILEKIDLPSNTKSLGNLMFHSNNSVHTFICRATTPPTACLETFGRIVPTSGTNAYVGNLVTGDKILYVPYGCKSKYEDATIDGNELSVKTDGEGNITSTNENYWKTVLVDECHFEVVELDENGDIPTVE